MKKNNTGFISLFLRDKTATQNALNVRFTAAGILCFFLAPHSNAQQIRKDSLKRDTVLTGRIDEIVVTGYKAQKRADINQAQVEITSQKLSEQPNSLSLSNMLQGKASGVFIQTQSGKPGSAGNISIRGIANFDNTDPTIVVDGQYVTMQEFNAINPNEVESVTVLKDAASAAQYGSRGASGVIVVTTKRGTAKKTEFFFNTRMGFSQKVPDRQLNFQMMNARQKLEFENAIAPLVGGRTYSAEDVARLSALDTDWQKAILQNSFEESYFLSAAGGGEKSNFYYSMGYDHNSGIVKYLDAFKRYSARFKFENQLTEKLRMGLNTSASYEKTRDVNNINSAYNPIFYMYGANPYQPVYNSDGSYNIDQFGASLFEQLIENPGYSKRTVFNGNFFAEYSLLKDLKFRTSLNNTYSIGDYEEVVRKGTDLDLTYGYDGRLNLIKNTNYILTFNNRLDYARSFSDHRLEATLFHEFYSSEYKSIYTVVTGVKNKYLNPFVPQNYRTPDDTSGSLSKSVNSSLASIVDYNYASTYYLSLSARRDGSSRFGENNKYGSFWSVSGGWNLAKEDFFKIPGLDLFKLRASYGHLGNDSSLSDYSNFDYIYFERYGPYAGAAPSAGNPDLRWEKSKVQNYGLNFSIKNRLSGSFEYFKNKRSDFIQYVFGSHVYGEYYYPINIGDIENRGVEAELSYDIISNRARNFVWNVHGNVSSIKNKVLKLQDYELERRRDAFNIFKVGEAPDLFFLVKNAGVDPQTGEAQYYKKDGTLTTEYSYSDSQILYGKSPYPKIFGGFGTTVTFGKFDMSASFSFKYGGWTLNTAERLRINAVANSNNKSTDALNFWKNPGDTNVLPKPSPGGIALTDYFLQKTDNINFNSFNLGYTFDKAFWGENSPVKSLRVYFQGQNLYVWTKFKGDPNVAKGNDDFFFGSRIANSFYAFNYPVQRTFTLGFNVNF